MKKILTLATAHYLSVLKDLKSVSVSFTYTKKTNPSQSKTRHMGLDLESLSNKVSKSKVIQMVKTKVTNLKNNTNHVREEFEIMAAYKWKVIWLDEMGNERESYHETVMERNSKMQALADDGYSPVFREIQS